MAVIANIAVYECDHCKAVVVCTDAASWDAFETDWHETILHHFCPVCRHMPEVSAIAARDLEALKESIAKRKAETPDAEESAYVS